MISQRTAQKLIAAHHKGKESRMQMPPSLFPFEAAIIFNTEIKMHLKSFVCCIGDPWHL